MSSSSLRNSSLFCYALLCSSPSHPSLTFFTLLYSARLCSTVCFCMSSGCSRQGAVMAPSSASSRTWRAILQDEVCPCPCNDCNGHTPSSWIWNFRQSGQESTTWKKALLWVLCIHQYAAACCSVRPASHRRHSSALPAKSAILPGTITFAMERVDAQPTALTPPA